MLLKHSNKPKQYIQGWVEFYKLKFKLTPDVLIPRPETELLVDEVFHYLRTLKTANSRLITILDIGTGAGNIAISLAKNLASYFLSGNVDIIATDISTKALNVARKNASLHEVLQRITFIKGDLLSNFSLPPTNPNLIIVTNLPYIPSARIPYLDSSVKDFEPILALDGGADGFDLYRKLFQQIKSFEGEQGWKLKLIICEIDYTHKDLSILEALKYFPNFAVEVKTDLAYKQRILKIKPNLP